MLKEILPIALGNKNGMGVTRSVEFKENKGICDTDTLQINREISAVSVMQI